MGAVVDIWHRLLASDSNSLPHAVCLDYGPALWLHAGADGVIALCYYSIPFALVYFAWRRTDLQFRWIFVMFGLFILACGTTHLMHVWTLFYPDYLLSGAVKLVTALISLGTAIALWPLLPKALALPGPEQWAAVKIALMREIDERHAAEAMVRTANSALEQRVGQRTAELEQANRRMMDEIDHRRVVEEQLRRAKEEAERANLSKSKFLAAASHDLRQPVQAMFYFTEALSYRLPDERSAEVLADLNRSLGGLKSLLDSLLDMSKLDAGVVVPHVETFAVNELLHRVAAEFRPTAREKQVELMVMPCAATVRSDPALLGRILQNLVANAVRYTEQGRILVGCRRRGTHLSIEVWDTGIGIPESRLAEIFEEFTQLGNFERDRSQGLGLGLAIVRRLSQLLAHPVAVRSQPGKGSVFSVAVPLVADRQQRAA